ncbi:biotin-dependent carboxyltransferase family protein [Rathayibacter festucae]|uniref:5-oxoprolinase subunit C family protein n=1 Tax=Rathayibacter festucae TaxID=110937 RepID=UPI001FB30952|nr:biotin-dependent carboxyltransferase family protein [Rathayibacter festucae]MCJ1699258.1 biotin-dependent carboxyltransferase family protein [Rathayibacter festucae]
MSLRILDPGPLALIQDEGRPGHAAVGVGRSGAMDRGALRLANRLLGNAPDAAALELLGAGFTARFETPAWISLTGAAGAATLDGAALARVLPTLAPAGSVLRLGPLTTGLRRTLGVRGGIAAPPVLGSRSRDTLSALGPAPLRPGDLLAFGTPAGEVLLPDWWPIDPPRNPVLRVHPGPRLDLLPPGTWQRLLTGPWHLSPSADRVGLRLSGTPLPTGAAPDLPSEALVPGAIQLPPSGLPVLFGPDHPTTGGYPVIAVMAAASLDHLAHLTPGDEVHFHA